MNISPSCQEHFLVLAHNRLGHHATIFELNVDSIGVLTSGWHFATLPLLIGGTHGSVIQAQRQ